MPASLPGAYRYTNGDVNVLPFSYTLSNLPALLRDSADNHMSQAYTVPSTPNIPFPTLPMTFPNLAMYLQAVLDESRRHLGDSSSGVRKLAKMYDACYPPSPHEASLYPPETPNSVGGLFKRVIGRGNRNNKKARGTNEDTLYVLHLATLSSHFDAVPTANSLHPSDQTNGELRASSLGVLACNPAAFVSIVLLSLGFHRRHCIYNNVNYANTVSHISRVQSVYVTSPPPKG